MRILWHSNHPAGSTGYATQSATIIARLVAAGHTVIFSAFWGNQQGPEVLDNTLILGTSKEGYGNDMLAARAKAHNVDIVITLIDAWVINPQVTSQFRWVPYFPVDCDPLPPGVNASLQTAYRRIAYSQWGQNLTKDAGLDALYIPHCVDTQAYAPIEKQEARRMAGVPEDRRDWFFAGIVAANKGYPSRKCFDQQIRAFAAFHREVPKSMLVLHADVWGGWQGENIQRICELAGLKPEDVVLPPEYEFKEGMIDVPYMRRLYSSLDVLMNATRGEGFGIPIIEAMACGRPAIVTDFSAMPELVDAGAGWKVRVAERFFYQDSYQVIPSTEDITRALHEAYAARNDLSLQEKARAGVLAHYDADKVVKEQWLPTLAQIQADIDATDERKVARAAKRAAAMGSMKLVEKPAVIDAPKLAPTLLEKANGHAPTNLAASPFTEAMAKSTEDSIEPMVGA